MSYIIFGHARSGTSTLARSFMMNGMRQVGEPFNPNRKNEWIKRYKEGEDFRDIIADIFSKYDGIKMLDHHLSREQNCWYFENYKVLFLRRKNLLQAAVSEYLAKRTGVWQGYDDKKVGTQYQEVCIDIDWLDKRMCCWKRDFDYYESLKNENTMKLVYEDLYCEEFAKPILENVFEFVGFEVKDWRAIESCFDIKNKLNSERTYRLIKNFDEVQAFAKGTEYGGLV